VFSDASSPGGSFSTVSPLLQHQRQLRAGDGGAAAASTSAPPATAASASPTQQPVAIFKKPSILDAQVSDNPMRAAGKGQGAGSTPKLKASPTGGSSDSTPLSSSARSGDSPVADASLPRLLSSAGSFVGNVRFDATLHDEAESTIVLRRYSSRALMATASGSAGSGSNPSLLSLPPKAAALSPSGTEIALVVPAQQAPPNKPLVLAMNTAAAPASVTTVVSEDQPSVIAAGSVPARTKGYVPGRSVHEEVVKLKKVSVIRGDNELAARRQRQSENGETGYTFKARKTEIVTDNPDEERWESE
jgi:hypothetical protein